MSVSTHGHRTTQTVGSTAPLRRRRLRPRPCCPVPPSMMHSFTTQLLCGRLTPFASQARLPETPNEGAGGAQTSSRMPRAGAASSIPNKSEEGLGRAGGRQGRQKVPKKEGRGQDMLGQSRANRKLLRHSGGHTVLSATLGASISSQSTQDPSRTTSSSRPSAYVVSTCKVLNLLASEMRKERKLGSPDRRPDTDTCTHTDACACTHTHTHIHTPTSLPRIKGPVEVANSLQVLVF